MELPIHGQLSDLSRVRDVLATIQSASSKNRAGFHIYVARSSPKTRQLIQRVREQILLELETRSPELNIRPYPANDEIYFSVDPSLVVSQADAQHAFTDCHYDGPFWFMEGTFLRVLLSLTPNNHITTCFQKICHSLNEGEFSVIDYNRTRHCVAGKQDVHGPRRILLKFHFIVCSNIHSVWRCMLTAHMSYLWNIISRWAINLGTNPHSLIGRLFGLLVYFCTNLRK